ncbi:DoxX family membrane protein [Streptomyces sp. NPDC085995]|uniref:DoxX family protein n=1 Tax=Streptomyces sp. NPDC085995 TaxID=3154861 RepID=UPI0034219FE4
MEPLITLVAVTGLLLLAGVLGAARTVRRPVVALRGGLAAMFALTGSAHFVGMREEVVAMVPPALPCPGLLVTLSGIAEIGCAVALLRRRTARPAAAVLSVLLVVLFPANVHAAGGDVPWWDRLGPRTAQQVLFLTATVTVLVRHRAGPARWTVRAAAGGGDRSVPVPAWSLPARSGTGGPRTARTGTARTGTARTGTARTGTGIGTDKSGTDKSGTDKSGTSGSRTEMPGTERSGTEMPGTARSGTETSGRADRAGRDA